MTGSILRIANVKVNLGESISAEKIAQIPPIIEKLGGQEGNSAFGKLR